MRIRILASAIRDLRDGQEFYDRQEAGIGDYFQDCLFSDIDSLICVYPMAAVATRAGRPCVGRSSAFLPSQRKLP